MWSLCKSCLLLNAFFATTVIFTIAWKTDIWPPPILYANFDAYGAMVKCQNGSDVDLKKVEEFENSTDWDNLPNDRSLKCYLNCIFQEFGFVIPESKSYQFACFVGVVGDMNEWERGIILKLTSGCNKKSKLKAKDKCEQTYNFNVCMKQNDNEHYYGYNDLEFYLSKRTYANPRYTCDNPEGLEDWGIVELQGDLEVRGNQIMSGQFIGDLCFDKYGKPILIIGHHILHGKEQSLDKPFAVLKKRLHSVVPDEDDHLNETNLDVSNISMGRTILDSTISIEHKTVQKTEYYVQAIVKRKIVFKSRPKPIIANVAKKV